MKLDIQYTTKDNIYYNAQPKLFNELVQLISNYPCSYISMLAAKGKKSYVMRHPEYVPPYKHLLDWINGSLPLLADDSYTLSTKCYWILNGLTDFPKCKHQDCNKRFTQNVGIHGYKQFCCNKHANSAKQTIEKRKHACREKYGVDSPMQLQAIKDKSKNTCLKKYGYTTPLVCPKCIELGKQRRLLEYGNENWSNHEKAAQTLKKHLQEDPQFKTELRKKIQQTNIKNGHCKNWTNREKAKHTRLANNGNEYWTKDMQNKSKQTHAKKCQENPNYDNEIRAKIQQTNIERYGVSCTFQSNETKAKLNKWIKDNGGETNTFQTEAAKAKSRETMNDRYGAAYSLQSNEIRAKYDFNAINSKGNETKRKNGTFNTSKQEDNAYAALCKLYSCENVIRQYKSDKYPFNCDFYIKNLDLYIECNYNWTHGGHFFNANDPKDIETLDKWRSKNTKFYQNAIRTWTERDILKQQTAITNKLNYLVFWKAEEFDAWIIAATGVQYT